MPTVREKYIRIGFGFPRKYTYHIKKPWFSGTIDSKKAIELLQKLRSNGYSKITFTLMPNRDCDKRKEPPYVLSVGYWGVEDADQH